VPGIVPLFLDHYLVCPHSPLAVERKPERDNLEAILWQSNVRILVSYRLSNRFIEGCFQVTAMIPGDWSANRSNSVVGFLEVNFVGDGKGGSVVTKAEWAQTGLLPNSR